MQKIQQKVLHFHDRIWQGFRNRLNIKPVVGCKVEFDSGTIAAMPLEKALMNVKTRR